ncbi:MAG: DUF4411 family protein [Raoultibacter sp.]
MDRFIVDTNILVTAKNSEYGFDICPGFWDLLKKGFQSGRVVSHRLVRKEVLVGADELTEWVSELNESYFLDETEAEVKQYLEMCQWVKRNSYKETAIRDFESPGNADALLCAKAHVMGLVVVTLEVPSRSVSRVKIPDVCDAFDVRYLKTFEFVRELKAAFYLPSEHSLPEWEEPNLFSLPQ